MTQESEQDRAPPGLMAEFRRRRVFTTVASYAVVCFVVLQLADATFEPLGVPHWVLQSIISVALLGFPLVAYLGWAFDFSPGNGLTRARPLSRPWRTAELLCVLVFAMAVAATLWWVWNRNVPTLDSPVASLSRMAFPLPDTPSIAVLPFRTIGQYPEQEHFADGMTDDLITDLSQLSRLFVVARNSAFEFKGRNARPAEVAERLGVRYVLQGSVRRSGDKFRINAQLIDATTGGSIWADRYDGELADSLVLQDAVANSVVAALEIELTGREREAFDNRRTTGPEAREAFQRGWALYRQNTPRTFALAIEQFDAAIALDPNYLRSYAARAAVYQAALARDFTVRIGEWTRSLGLKPDDVMRHTLSNLRKAEAQPSALTLQVESQLSLWRNDFDRAIEAAQAAIALAPNDPLGYEALSAARTLGGDPRAGHESIEKALRLDPAYPDEYIFWQGLALFTDGDYTDARESLEFAMELNPGDDRVLIVLAATYGHLGRADDAQRTIASLDALQARRTDERSKSAPGDILEGIDIQLDGRYTLTEVDLWPFQAIADRERLREGLRLGGLPAMGTEDNQIPYEVAGATTVSTDEARILWERGVTVVDVRGLSDRNIGFIPESTFLNLQTTLSDSTLRAAVDPDVEVLFHCEGMR